MLTVSIEIPCLVWIVQDAVVVGQIDVEAVLKSAAGLVAEVELVELATPGLQHLRLLAEV